MLTFKYISNNYNGNAIVQEAVQQNEYISQFNPTSINTLRLAVYRSIKDDECHVLNAIMRIGGLGSVVDNAHAGGCFVGINKDGSFCNSVCNQFGERQVNFNGIDFSNNFNYPNWDKVTAFGKEVCSYVEHHRLLALDIALDKNGAPILIEFNRLPGSFSSWLFQYTVGPAFGEYTDEILSYCYEHRGTSKATIHV